MSRRDLAIHKILILLLTNDEAYRMNKDDKVRKPNPRQKEISGKE